MSKRTRLLNKLKHVYSHNTKLVLDVDNNDIGLIIEGVEKQIRKKPAECYAYHVEGVYIGTVYKCYKCKGNLLNDNYTQYCPNCGQKLDWSEVE